MARITLRPDLAITPPPPDQGHVRTPNVLHLSSIIRYIEKTAFKQKRDSFSDMDDREIALAHRRWEMGWMWEKVLDNAHAQRQTDDWPDGKGSQLILVGEMERDGIYLTPDRYNIKEERFEEFKATWKSSRGIREARMMGQEAFQSHIENKYWGYIAQLKAACWVGVTQFGRLRIFFVNSDYSRSANSEVMEYHVIDFEWEWEELEDNWQMLLNHAPIVAKEEGIKWP